MPPFFSGVAMMAGVIFPLPYRLARISLDKCRQTTGSGTCSNTGKLYRQINFLEDYS
ncbi:hypothetical protein SAMN05660330_00519 [Desulforhopalus singaporensis]|uniref:Uncharacterized protein n=1 Tax=Desulforhopalus singaporensis TaxID=91360 RepID=A0A1H0KJE1_9BACT|nr:hypothetical protein SAMN05660330_00519 [Desulforhopalus singaporensis]